MSGIHCCLYVWPKFSYRWICCFPTWLCIHCNDDVIHLWSTTTFESMSSNQLPSNQWTNLLAFRRRNFYSITYSTEAHPADNNDQPRRHTWTMNSKHRKVPSIYDSFSRTIEYFIVLCFSPATEPRKFLAVPDELYLTHWSVMKPKSIPDRKFKLKSTMYR